MHVLKCILQRILEQFEEEERNAEARRIDVARVQAYGDMKQADKEMGQGEKTQAESIEMQRSGVERELRHSKRKRED